MWFTIIIGMLFGPAIFCCVMLAVGIGIVATPLMVPVFAAALLFAKIFKKRINRSKSMCWS